MEIVTGDVTDYDSLLKAFKGAGYVYHLAGIISISSDYQGKVNKLQKVNVEGTRNVVKACFAQKIKRMVYASSIHAFPELPHGQTIVETKASTQTKTGRLCQIQSRGYEHRPDAWKRLDVL